MLADIIPKVAAMEAEAEEEKPYYPRPSGAGPERCERSMVYSALRTPKDPLPGRAMLIFDDSSWHEELTADWINKTVYQLHSRQMKITVAMNELTIDGSIDGIITDPLGVDRLLEHKAINHFTFQTYLAESALPLDNITQTCIYVRGAQADNPLITEALLLIKNKNTAQYMEFLLSYDTESDTATIIEIKSSMGDDIKINKTIQNIVGDAFDKFLRVAQHVESKTLPARQYDISHWRCGYCAWNKPCYQNYEDEFEALQTDIEMEGEIVELCKYYLETSMHVKEMEKEKDVLKEKIKAILEEKGVRKGKAGDYFIENRLQKRRTLDKELIPPEIIMQATSITTHPVLTIRKRKE